jgi:hypothetical protein
MMCQHISIEFEIRLDRRGFPKAHHLDRDPGTLKARDDRILKARGKVGPVALCGLVAKLNPDREPGAHGMGRRSGNARIANRIHIRGSIQTGLVQAGEG